MRRLRCWRHKLPKQTQSTMLINHVTHSPLNRKNNSWSMKKILWSRTHLWKHSNSEGDILVHVSPDWETTVREVQQSHKNPGWRKQSDCWRINNQVGDYFRKTNSKDDGGTVYQTEDKHRKYYARPLCWTLLCYLPEDWNSALWIYQWIFLQIHELW